MHLQVLKEVMVLRAEEAMIINYPIQQKKASNNQIQNHNTGGKIEKTKNIYI